METQFIRLNMIPSGVIPIFNISQYDVGRMLGVYVYAGIRNVNLDNYTVTVEATRSDGTAIIVGVTTNNNVGTFEVTPVMSNLANSYRAQLVITDENSRRIASLPFIINVIRAAMNENSEAIEEDATLYQQYTDAMQSIIAETKADIVDEATERQANIDAEAAARQSADNTLQSNIDAEVVARQSADNTLQSNIDNETSARIQSDTTINARIDEIIAPSGEAPSAAEVTDARIGANGVIHNTLGNAIREQIEDLKNISDVNTGATVIAFIYGKQIQTNVGIGNTVDVNNPITSAVAKHAIIPCTAGDVFTLNIVGGNGARAWCRTDANYNVIAVATASTTLTNGRIKIPDDGTAYLILNSINAGLSMNCFKGDTVNYRLNNALSIEPHSAWAGDALTVLADMDIAEKNKLYRVAAGTIAQLPANVPSWVGLKFLTIRLPYYYGNNVQFDLQLIIDFSLGGIVASRSNTNGTWSDWSPRQTPFVVVNSNGTGDYTTINDAINGTNDGDTILIMPGTYTESVRMFGKKRNLIGINREECIVYAGSGLYENPAIEINIGSAKNITFISGNDNSLSENSTDRKAYAAHIEHDNTTDYSCIFENCKFVSFLNAAVGIGCRYNQTIKFFNCYFETKAHITYSSSIDDFINSSAILFHNDGTNNMGGNGILIVENCELIGLTKAIMARSLENGSYMTARFKNTIAHIDNDGVNGVVGYWGTEERGISPYFCGTCIKLDKFSFGNLSDEINFANYWN